MSIPSSWGPSDKPKFCLIKTHPRESVNEFIGPTDRELVKRRWRVGGVTDGSVGDPEVITLKSLYSVCMRVFLKIAAYIDLF